MICYPPSSRSSISLITSLGIDVNKRITPPYEEIEQKEEEPKKVNDEDQEMTDETAITAMEEVSYSRYIPTNENSIDSLIEPNPISTEIVRGRILRIRGRRRRGR